MKFDIWRPEFFFTCVIVAAATLLELSMPKLVGENTNLLMIVPIDALFLFGLITSFYMSVLILGDELKEHNDPAPEGYKSAFELYLAAAAVASQASLSYLLSLRDMNIGVLLIAVTVLSPILLWVNYGAARKFF